MIAENKEPNNVYHNICIIIVWCAAIYSSIIQNKYYHIPNGMLIFGIAILVFYVCANNKNGFDFYDVLTNENQCMLYFMAYMLVVGLLFSPNKNSHISQWITCIEYLFLQIVITSLIKKTGTDTFHVLLLVEAGILAVIFIVNPINYHGSGRYSISNTVNPNGLGMGFAAGIWVTLYKQQKSKLPLLLVGSLVALLGYCILLTGSRKSLIGASLAIVLWLLFCFLPSLKEKGFFLGLAALFSMIVLAIIIGKYFFSVYSESSIAARMDNLLNSSAEGSRSDLYREGYEIIKDNPLFGIGFQGFSYYIGTYSHATLVEIPVSGGIVGAILYFAAYIISIKQIINIYRTTKNANNLTAYHIRIKMIMILYAMIVFYTTCIIHPYQFESCLLFGIVFGETAYLKNELKEKLLVPTEDMREKNKYIKDQ